MIVTAILCTFNRCKILARALESLAASQMPQSTEWEVLVVDNNSTDNTRAVVEHWQRHQPERFRYLFERQQGKSYALNAGVREARGDVLVFVDDDVRVESDWLANLTSALRDGLWAGAGGRILPEWPCARPAWLPVSGQYSSAPFAMFDLGDKAGPLAEPPFGANMAFRKSVFASHGGFRTDLGPSPGSEIRGEDTEFGRRLLMAGERLCYVPSAVVYHPVPEERLTREYHLAWWYDKARANVIEAGVPVTRWRVCGVPMRVLRHLVRWCVQWLAEPRPKRRFEAKLNLYTALGEIAESRRRFAHIQRGEPDIPEVTGP